ncbi:MAG: OmpA family protein [Bacteroidales bacterium]|nr:OmpA family protein [Bacteroidales bacterium]
MKKTITVLLSLWLSVLFAFSQSASLKLIYEGEYEKAEKKINKGLEKKADDVEYLLLKSILLMQRNFTGYNTETSYDLLSMAKSTYKKISDEKLLSKLEEIPINQSVLAAYTDSVCYYALADASNENTLQAYERYLSFYKESPQKYRTTAIDKRNTVAYAAALELNSIAAWEEFMSTYPDARQFSDAEANRNILLFEEIRKEDDIDTYKEFIGRYPKAAQVPEAWARIYELEYAIAEKENTSAAYKNYMESYPKSPKMAQAQEMYDQRMYVENTVAGKWQSYRDFILTWPSNRYIGQALDKMVVIAMEEKNMEALKFCIDRISDSRREEALMVYYELFTSDGDVASINLFFELYTVEALNERKVKDITNALLGLLLELTSPYDKSNFSSYDNYIKAAAPKDLAFVAVQRMIAENLKKADWTGALKTVESYREFFATSPGHFNNLVELLTAPVDKTVVVNNCGDNVSTADGNEYLPHITADESEMYFCAQSRADNIGGEDVFVSRKVNGVWGPATLVTELSDDESNDAPISISTDGTMLILFINGSLYSSEKTGSGWGKPVPLPANINSGEWQCDAMITSDGKAMLFSSTREGGYNLGVETSGYHGDNQYASDIWVSLADDNGNWGVPINLGSTINTRFCDRSPFLHPDMKTLYFSSDGHGGLGRLDVFKSTRLADTCWNCWSEPVNLGKEINTENSDWGYNISTDGKTAYYARTRTSTDKNDLFWLTLPDKMRPDMVATISGKILDKNQQPIAAEIVWEDLESGKKVGKSKSDPNDGSFFVVLPLGKIYGYYVEQENYFPVSNNIDLRETKEKIVVEENIAITSFDQMIEEGDAVKVNNLFFNFGESTLLPYSLPELRRVAAIIKKNNLKVELSGHTDNIGNATDNQVLSEKRARAVKDFLVNEGCPDSLFTVVGYGMTQPVADNSTDEGRALNRRVELRFIK